MNLVVLSLLNPATLQFTITRPTIHSFAEVQQGYQAYRLHLQRALTTGQPLHVILNLRAVTSIDPKLMDYILQMREYLKTIPDLPPIVDQLTVQVPSLVIRGVLKQVLPFCAGKHVKIHMET